MLAGGFGVHKELAGAGKDQLLIAAITAPACDDAAICALQKAPDKTAGLIRSKSPGQRAFAQQAGLQDRGENGRLDPVPCIGGSVAAGNQSRAHVLHGLAQVAAQLAGLFNRLLLFQPLTDDLFQRLAFGIGCGFHGLAETDHFLLNRICLAQDLQPFALALHQAFNGLAFAVGG